MIPKGAERYFLKLGGNCTGWSGRKYYGRPAWTLWMQRLVWEEKFGEIPAKARVSETCETHGCLTPEHLTLKERLPRTPKTNCRNCGGLLSRDVNNKTYCQQCLAMKARVRRNV